MSKSYAGFCRYRLIRLYEFVCLCSVTGELPVKPDDHSEVAPLLPIPNRTVKRFSADDSADSRVKVGHCQAITQKHPTGNSRVFSFVRRIGERRWGLSAQICRIN